MKISPCLEDEQIAIKYNSISTFGGSYTVAISFNQYFDDLYLAKILEEIADSENPLSEEVYDRLVGYERVGYVVIASDDNPIIALQKAIEKYNDKWASYKP